MTAAGSPHDAVKGKPLYIGPAGWSYDDWRGIVYPAVSSGRFDPLAYLSRYFTAIEVNVTFYQPVSARTTAAWVRRVPDSGRFRFTFKLNQRFTHERDRPYAAQEAREFKDGLLPAAESGLLGCLLAQFPWSFRCNEDAFRWLERIRSDFGEYPLAVEVRHRSWEHPEAFERLREMGLSLCSIDQPRLRGCMRPVEIVTGPIAYIRLHGRNAENWFAEDIASHERYNYLYGREELSEWAERIARIADLAEEIYVIANNHYRGQAPANALQLRSMLTGRKVEVPPQMFEHYADLKEVASNTPPARQAELF